MNEPKHVFKLGGSLLDLPDLSQRLLCIPELWNGGAVLIVGGGRGADRVRELDQIHGFSAEKSHWLAIRAMQFNTHLIQATMEKSKIVHDPSQLSVAIADDFLAVIDPFEWLQREARAGISVPDSWEFTSDSIAAHIAKQIHAQKLTLLKSSLPASGLDVDQCAEHGMVDAFFPVFSRDISHIDFLNVRSQPATRFVLR